MSDNTKIEWTDATWNPLIGCSRVSTGCVNCYAEGIAYRFSEQEGSPFFGTAKRVNGHSVWTGRVNVNERVMDQPLRWQRPRKIFVNSLSDLFHESVSIETIDRVFAVMAQAPQHTFQILTKRAERMLDYCEMVAVRNGIGGADFPEDTPIPKFVEYPLRNVWLGVSVENQAAADDRIPLLLLTPTAVRFLSCEPLLGHIDLRKVFDDDLGTIDSLTPGYFPNRRPPPRPRPAIDWVIAGGESGHDARPMHPDWARSLRDQCDRAGVPFFFKQWGEFASVSEVEGPGTHYTFPDGTTVRRVGKKLAGNTLDHREHKAFPETT